MARIIGVIRLLVLSKPKGGNWLIKGGIID
jgi:hypothetical protein